MEPFRWPSDQQELLLRAALLHGPDGIADWHSWRASVRLDGLDGDSQWLLPQLYCNLHAHGVGTEFLARYRNVYLHNWYKNNLTLRRVEAGLRRLQQTYHAVVLLEGAAMALRHYDAVGARPFDRLKVLVLKDRRSSSSCEAEDGIDQQASLFDAETDRAVVRRATEADWMSNRWFVLDPADQLVDICVRRERWDHRSVLLWVADAATVVRCNADLDWGRVSSLAARVNRQASVARALRYLDERIGLAIPASARHALGATSSEVPA